MMKRFHHNCSSFRALKFAYIVHLHDSPFERPFLDTRSIDAIAAAFFYMWGFFNSESLHTMIRCMNVLCSSSLQSSRFHITIFHFMIYFTCAGRRFQS